MWQTSKSFLLLLLVIILAPAFAGAEMIAGTVLSVDRDQGLLIIRTNAEHDVQVDTEISSLPRRLMPGKQIRIWGEFQPDSKYFTATDIRGPGKSPHHDPTGVRARIGNGKYCRKSSNSPLLDKDKEQHESQDSGNGSGGSSR